MSRNFDHRLQRLEQTTADVIDPPRDLSMWIIAFGLRSRCLIVDPFTGNFRPYLPNFSDPYWRNVAAWLNHFKAGAHVSAAQIVQEVIEYAEYERQIDEFRAAIQPQAED